MCRNKNCSIVATHDYLFGYCSGCFENVEHPRLFDYELYRNMFGAWGRIERYDTEAEALNEMSILSKYGSDKFVIMTFNRSNMEREIIHTSDKEAGHE